MLKLLSSALTSRPRDQKKTCSLFEPVWYCNDGGTLNSGVECGGLADLLPV